jgi:hypothetical protein
VPVLARITSSHHITSHHITSHHITPHHITSHHITSHHITSHHITSHHVKYRGVRGFTFTFTPTQRGMTYMSPCSSCTLHGRMSHRLRVMLPTTAAQMAYRTRCIPSLSYVAFLPRSRSYYGAGFASAPLLLLLRLAVA